MSKLLPHILKVFLTLLIPFVVVLGVVRLVANESYLAFEYGKFDFPEDAYGFARAMRLTHAAANIQFVIQNQPLANLAEQDHDGIPLYTTRELSHMQDVQNVYQATWRVWQLALVLTVLCGLSLTWRKVNHPAFASAVQWGGALTVAIVVVIGLGAITAWQDWFILFHQVFFANGTWTFNNTDTLIRLFPEKFWYDTALTISNLSPLVGILVYWIGSRLLKSSNGNTGKNIGTNYRSVVAP
jgi:integral membrane protein (TIGR01906 family)